MNDFTKEELESIWNCVDLYTDHKEHPYQPLLDKIQSMIDNYCEHDLDGIDGVTGQQCKKCDRWFD